VKAAGPERERGKRRRKKKRGKSVRQQPKLNHVRPSIRSRSWRKPSVGGEGGKKGMPLLSPEEGKGESVRGGERKRGAHSGCILPHTRRFTDAAARAYEKGRGGEKGKKKVFPYFAFPVAKNNAFQIVIFYRRTEEKGEGERKKEGGRPARRTLTNLLCVSRRSRFRGGGREGGTSKSSFGRLSAEATTIGRIHTRKEKREEGKKKGIEYPLPTFPFFHCSQSPSTHAAP